MKRLVFALALFCLLAGAHGYFYLENEWQFVSGETPYVDVCSWQNTGKVDLELYRLDADAIHSFVSSEDSEEALRIAFQQGPLMTKTTSLYTYSGRDCERWDLAGLEKGMYVVFASSNEDNRTAAFLVSDLALTTKSWSDEGLVYSFDLKTGEPVPGAQAKFFQDGGLVVMKSSDADGIVHVSGLEEDKDLDIIATKGEDIALQSTYRYWWYGDQTKFYVYSDRPVYRPDQDVYFKVIVWDVKDGDYSVSEGTVNVTIEDSKGNEVYKETLEINDFGSVSGKMSLGDEPPLGYYSIRVKYGEKNGYGSFQVQEYKKPEYQVSVEAEEEQYISGDTVAADITAEYFFGAPVPDAEVEYTVRRSGWYYPCKGYYCWYIDEPYSYYYGYYGEVVEEGYATTDFNGQARIEFEAETDHNSVYIIEAKVIDKSRREITGTGSVIVARAEFDFFVETDSYSYEKGDKVKITIDAEDLDETPLSEAGRLEVIRYTWTRGKGRENVTLVDREFETGEDGRFTTDFTPDSNGRFEVRATGRDSRGNKVVSSTWFYVYEKGRYDYWDDLEVILDKEAYEVGDTAMITINAPVSDFNALLTVEGAELYHYEVVKAEGTSALVELEITEDFQPNTQIYVAVFEDKTQYSDWGQLIVPPVSKFITVEVSSDKEEYAPGEEAVFTVTTKDSEGNPVEAELSLGIVDESIYDIVEELVQQIEKFFYGYRNNRVRTGNSWMWGGGIRYEVQGAADDALEATGAAPMAAPEEAKSAVGEFAAATLRKYFPDTAFWHAFVKTDQTGTAIVRLTMPDSLTTWRATARAIDKDFRVGQTTDKVVTTKDLLVRLQTPRFLTQKDELIISGVVHNYLGKMKDVRLELEADGVELLDPAVQEVQVAHGADERVDWRIRVDDCCSAKFVIKALTDEESDAMELVLPIVPHGVETQDAWAGSVEDSITKEINVPEDSVYGATEVKLVISPSIAAAAFDALEYLAQYPYGCVEQTMSAFLPDVLIKQVLDDLGIENEELEAELPKMVSDGLQKLYKMQHGDGGWGWWEEDDTHPYMTAYVMYGLANAKAAGYLVDDSVMSRGLGSLKNQYTKSSIDANTKEYMAYSLSFFGDVDVSSITDSKLSDYGKALKALAEVRMGQRDEFPAELRESAVCDEFECHWSSDTFKYSWRNNEVETTSYVLMLLLKTEPQDDMVERTVRWLMGQRRGKRWYSTKDTAIAVFAMAEYMKISKELSPDYVAKVYVNGDLVESVKKDDAFSPDNELVLDVPAGRNSITIEKDGSGKLYYSLFLKYFLEEDPIKPKSSGISISRRYSKTSAMSGEEINVTLTIDVSEDTEYIILEDPIPAGCEVVQAELNAVPYPRYDYGYDYGYDVAEVAVAVAPMRDSYGYWPYWYNRREVRDEKVVYFVTYLQPGKNEITYTLRAEIPGSYRVMPAKAWNMYDEKISGHSAEDFLQVADKVRVSIKDLEVGDDYVKFSVDALKLVEGDLSGEVGILLKDADGAVLTQMREYLSLVNRTGIMDVQLDIALEDGLYSLTYTLTTSDGDVISGTKRVQVGEIKEPDDFEYTVGGRGFEDPIAEIVLLSIGVIAILLLLALLINKKTKRSKKPKK